MVKNINVTKITNTKQQRCVLSTHASLEKLGCSLNILYTLPECFKEEQVNLIKVDYSMKLSRLPTKGKWCRETRNWK